MKRGQSAIEFVILVSFMLAVFFIFFVVIQSRIVDISIEQDRLYLQEANNIVVAEVDIAFAAAPDFQHTFVIPSKGLNTFYINITNNREVVSSYETLEYVNFFPFNVTGHLNGLDQNNTVYGVDGIATFPDETDVSVPGFAGVHMNVNPETCYVADTLGECANPLVINPNMVPLCQLYFSLC